MALHALKTRQSFDQGHYYNSLLELATMALLQLTPALCSTVGARNDGAATTCCGIVATHNVATLWHAAVARNVAARCCSSQHCDTMVLWRCNSRRGNDGRWCLVALQRWWRWPPKFLFFYFFYSIVSREKESKTKRKEKEL